MPAISIMPVRPCNVQKIYDIEIAPNSAKPNSKSENNKIFSYSYDYRQIESQAARAPSLPGVNIDSSEKVSKIETSKTINKNEEPMRTARSQTLPKKANDDVPRYSTAKSNVSVTAPSIAASDQYSEESSLAESISINISTTPQLSENGKIVRDFQHIGYDPESSSSTWLTKTAPALNYSNSNAAVKNFIEDIFEMDADKTTSIINEKAMDVFEREHSLDKIDHLASKNIFTETVEKIRKDKTSLDLETSMKSARALKDNILMEKEQENWCGGWNVRSKDTNIETEGEIHETDNRKSPKRNEEGLQLNQSLSSLSLNFDGFREMNRRAPISCTELCQHSKQQRIGYCQSSNSAEKLKRKASVSAPISMNKTYDADLESLSTTTDFSPKNYHGMHGIRESSRSRRRSRPPSPKLPILTPSMVTLSPNFSRTIKSIKSSASSPDRRPTLYKDASDKEIQIAAERFLRSVEKERQCPRLFSSGQSSDSEEEIGDFRRCQIVDDHVIQSAFTNVLDEGGNDTTSDFDFEKELEFSGLGKIHPVFSDSSDLEYSMSSIGYQISKLKLLGFNNSKTSMTQEPTHRMPYGCLDISEGEVLSEGEIRTGSNEEF